MKTISVTSAWMLVLFTIFSIQAQSTFFKHFECEGFDCLNRPNGFTPLPDGTYLMAGGREVARFSASGEELWRTRNTKGEYLDWSAMAIADNQIWIAGILLQQGRQYIFLSKMDELGNFSEGTFIEPADSNTVEYIQLAALPNNEVILAATISPRDTFNQDIWVAKVNGQLEIAWEMVHGEKNIHNRVQALKLASNGNIALTGIEDGRAFLLILEENGFLKSKNLLSVGYLTWGIGIDTLPDGFIITGQIDDNILLWRTNAMGQTQWMRNLDVKQVDSGWDVKATADGFIVTGYTNYSKSFTSDDGDIFLLKTNTNGFMEWFRAFGSPGTDRGMHVQPLTDGFIVSGLVNLYQIGSTAAFFKTDLRGHIPRSVPTQVDSTSAQVYPLNSHLKTQQILDMVNTDDSHVLVAGVYQPYQIGNESIYHPFWAKLTPEGDTVWQHLSKDTTVSPNLSLAKGTDGSYMMVVNRGTSFFTSYYQFYGLNANGEVRWSKLHGSATGTINKVIPTPDDAFLLVGTIDKKFVDYDAYLIKIDRDGNILWENNINNGEWEILRDGVALPNGDFLLIGSYRKEFDVTSNFYAMRINNQGQPLWQKIYPPFNQIDEAFSITPTADGHWLIAGSNRDYKGTNKDVQLLKIDANGNQIWSKNHDFFDWDEARDAVPTEDGGFLISGTSGYQLAGPLEGYSTALKIDSLGNAEWYRILGQKGLRSRAHHLVKIKDRYLLGGSADVAYPVTYLQTLCLTANGNSCDVISGVEEPFATDVVVYPNPSSGVFRLHLEDSFTSAVVSVFDLQGRLLFSENVNNNHIMEFDLTSYTAGVYLLRLQNGNQVLTGKLIKQ